LALCLLSQQHANSKKLPALRVTISYGDGESVTLKVEGKVCGAKVPELRRAWETLAPALGSRRLSVDLCGVTSVDTTGKQVLAEIHSETGANFLADTPLTKYFAEQAQEEIHSDLI
jgi:hypothetical protein